MNYWLVAILSLIFTGLYGTLVVNLIGNHIIDVHNAARGEGAFRTRKKMSQKWFVDRFVAAMLCGLTASGLGCLIFSVIKLIGG